VANFAGYTSNSPSFGFINSYADGTSYGTISVYLTAGQTLSMGTTNMDGAQCTGQTFLGLVGPAGTATIASNGNYEGTGCSYLQYTAVDSGAYLIQEGCVGLTQCSGTVSYSISTVPSASGQSSGSCAAYTSTDPQLGLVIGSNGGAPMYATCNVVLEAGATISVGTTYVAGSVCAGNTFLALQSPSGALVSYSEDTGSDGSNVCSFMQATVPASGTYVIQEGCSPDAEQGCSGTVVFTVTQPGAA
jgi:hypothetical protein